MKKSLLYGLSAVMLLSLTACGAKQADEPDTAPPSAVQTEPPQGSAAPSDKPDNAVEPLSGNGGVKDAAGTELYTIFEQGYQGGQIYAEFGSSEEELILMEIGEVESILGVRTDVKAPADLETQYRAWRAEAHPAAPAQAEVQLFAECNEVVYAVDQVNIRASYTVNSNKLGSLTRGQSITRIGTAIPGTEAEGWSRVQLSDGTIAYMVSSYLSTSKPQQGNQDRAPQTGGGTGTYTQPQGGGDIDGTDPFGYEAPKGNLDETKKTTDYGYEPEDPSGYIYGP